MFLMLIENITNNDDLPSYADAIKNLQYANEK